MFTPAVAQAPVDGAHDERQDDGEHEAHSVVVGRAPVGDEVLLQQQLQLARLRLRVRALEVQIAAAPRRHAQLGNQLLILPAGFKNRASLIPANVLFITSSLPDTKEEAS